MRRGPQAASLRMVRNHRSRRWLVVVLAVLGIGMAWRFFVPDEQRAQHHKNQAAREALDVLEAPPIDVPGRTLLGSAPASSVLKEDKLPVIHATAVYDAEEFTHVPVWIPRPVEARSARAVDASLRSDGFVEGKVFFEFGPEAGDALAMMSSHLKAAGLHANPDASVFSSEDPPRRCEVEAKTTPEGGLLLGLAYHGTDHEKACLCPTCSHSEAPKPASF